jgi:hypothetical protein
MGGLGNQLFQIFATIAYAIKYGHKFIFPYTDYLKAGVTRPTYWENFLHSLKIFTTENPKTGITNRMLENFQEIRLLFHNYQNIPMVSLSDNVRLFGYFQSYKYFQEYENTIFSMLRLENQIQKVKEEYRVYFDENKYTVSMHFRLGDYKHVQNCHNILPEIYYQMSMKHVISLISKPIRVLVFCESEDNDHVNGIITNLKKEGSEIEYVKIDDNIVDWKQMLLMASCDSNIIANSSFSWWAAYFNRNKDIIVTYPSVWFGPVLNHNYMGDMFPDNWKQICF